MTTEKAVLVVSDLHCGSIYGMLPPDFNTQDGAPKVPNVGQKYLWECWLDMAKRVCKLPIIAIVVNGDATEGEEARARGAELCLSLPSDQARCAAVCLRKLQRSIKSKPPFYVIRGCVAPGHLVLTRDLRWVPVETLKVGDRLIAPSEGAAGHGARGRSWVESTVTAATPMSAPCCNVELEDGTTFTCTEDHPWLTYHGSAMVWTIARRLRSGRSRLVKLLPTWETNTDWSGGWLAGFFDGEGTLCQKKYSSCRGVRSLVDATQKPGPVLDNAIALLNEMDFSHSIYDHDRRSESGTLTIHLKGGMPSVLRFLGSVRPLRLLEKFNPSILGRVRAEGFVRVKSVNPVGEKVVIGLSTSSGTYLVDGFGSHNTPYHDSHGGQLAESVAEKIGARTYSGYGAGVFCRRAMDLEHDGVLVNFSHGTSVAGGLYRATPPDREAVWSALAGKEGKAAKADAVIRAHAHHFVRVEHPTKHAVIGPCWQLQTDYMGKNSCYRMLPDIGAIVVWLDPAAKRRGEDPIHVEKILYRLPKVSATRI